MNAPDHEQVDELIRKALPDQPPPDVAGRLRSQMAEFRTKLAAAAPLSPCAGVWIGRARWGLGITAAAAVVAAIVVALALRAETSFAEVAAAVLKQPWIHAQETFTGGKMSEGWFSESQQISVLRRPDSVEYRDGRLQVYYTYNLKEQVLYRGPEYRRTASNYYGSMAAGICLLLQQERTLDKPLTHLEFLDLARDRMKVLDQEVAKVTVDGRLWLDYRMTVSVPDLAQPATLLFRVDATTKLPRLCRFEGQWQGKPTIDETRFDYPEIGPADVYALGVPKSAKLVDRVPAGDLKRILETLRAGRERMDNYRSVFVMHSDDVNSKWWTVLPDVMYRRGDKFRADYAGGLPAAPELAKHPAKDEDRGKWWRERVKHFKFYPQYVMRGSTWYASKTKSVTDADGSDHLEIVAVDRFDYNTQPGDTFPPDYSMRPEFACRAPTGIGDAHLQPTVNLNPADGPRGCILLTVQHTSREGRIDAKGVGMPDEWRYWLDPKRDYISMRWDMVVRSDAGKEEIIDSFTIEDVAKSPRGIWYATRIRRKNAITDMNGAKSDQIYDFYVDFDVDLPDAFFDPPVPGRSQ
jgi:hypothetical protein